MPGNPALMRGDRRDFLRCGGNGFTMMRRWIAALLAACLLPALCSVALADGGFVITVPVVQGTLEEDIAVEIALSGCQDMDSLQMCVNYDQTALRLVSAEAGELLGGGLHALNTDEPGLVALAYAAREGLTDQGTVLTLVFAALSDQGSAIVVTDVLATVYDAESGVQSKLYGTVENGGVAIGEAGSVPEAVITPWPEETPVPTPSPTPEPTAEPTAAPEESAAPEASAGDGGGTRPAAFYVFLAAIVLLIIALALLFVLRRRKQ